MKHSKTQIPTSTPSLQKMMNFVQEMHTQPSTSQTPTSTTQQTVQSQPRHWFMDPDDSPIQPRKVKPDYIPDLPQQEVKVLPQMWLTDSDEEIQQSPLQYSQSTLTDSDNIWQTSSPRIQLILSTNQETSLNESKSSRPKWLTRCIDRLLRPFKRRQGHHRR